MIGRTNQSREPFAPWSARVSIFASILVLVGMLLHRTSVLTTPAATNLIGLGFILAAAGLALGLYAATSIWIRGRTGAWNSAWGILISGLLWLWPLALVSPYLALPHINDVTTDTIKPPAFTMAAKQRPAGANSTVYGGRVIAEKQSRGYPDLKTLVIPRPAEEVYELALDLVGGRHGLGWTVIAEAAPQARLQRPGVIEATERTLVLGFTDDISIRIAGTDAEARLDIRSASRYGDFDFGANAARIRRFAHELATRLDAAGPIGVASRGGVRINRAGAPSATVKRLLDRNARTAAPTR